MVTRIFISYSQEDFKSEARYICNYLSKHIRDSAVYIDQLKPKGIKWREENERQLLESDIFIVALTNGGLLSDEVKKEVELAKTDASKIIIPCKDELLDMRWNEIKWDLGKYDGVEFEEKEQLGRRLVSAIRSITPHVNVGRKQTSETKPISIHGINTRLNLMYKITHGEILSARFDKDTNSLIICIASFGNGEMELVFRRHVFDSKRGKEDDQFFVLINNEESDYTETISDVDRTLKIKLPHESGQIEIIGTEIMGTSYVGQVKDENIIEIPQDSSVSHEKWNFDKKTLKIRTGEKVQWVNNGFHNHSIISGTLEGGPDGCFDSPLLVSGSSFAVAFEKQGIYDYFCVFHPWETGKIIVE